MRRSLSLFGLALSIACSDGSSEAPDASTSTPDAGSATSDASAAPDATTTEPDAGTGLDEEGCRILELGPRDFQFNMFGQLTGLRYPVTPNLDGDAPEVLLVELYDSTTEGLPPLATGAFDLAAPGDDNLATCQHCLWVRVDETNDGATNVIYFQTKGTITLDRVSDPFEPAFAGSTGRVVLRRATVTEEGRSELVTGGDCVSIPALAFDTTPTPGAKCLNAEDCGNPLLEVCDPASNQCTEPQCGEFASCPGTTDVCVTQYGELFFGACYQSCDPTVTTGLGCGDGLRCVQFGVDPTFGLCKYLGESATGAPCESSDNSTACAGAAVCSTVTRTCTPSCEYFEAATGCPTGTVCSLFGVCEPPTIGRDVGFGAACEPTDELATACASDGQAFRGICFAYPPAAPVCEKACLGDRGCDVGEFCALRFSSGLGICRPLPVCGDGELGEIDELCDDGNTTSGDGCSADCRTVEYDVICASVPAIGVNATVQGDTTAARDGFQSTCQLGLARASLYAISPPSPGRLTLELDSPTNHTLALRSTCDEVGSELACAEVGQGGETERITFQVTSTSAPAITAVVSAFTVLEQGPFTLRTSFVPESCGDGVLAGREVCDDGNTTSGDGCRSDCREVEYDFYCAGARELSTTTLNIGDTTGAPNLFASRCSTDVGSVSSSDQLYRWVAPADGDLHLFLNSPNNLVVAVFDSCDRPENVTELACNASFTLGTVDVPVTAGQALLVLVDGFIPRDVGAYELEATFTPR